MNRTLLFLTVLVIASCGLVYELIAGTLASYVLGDSVTQFSTVIGVYLSALGLGSYLSRFIDKAIPRRFVEIELAVAFVGGISAPLLFLCFSFTDAFRVALYLVVIAVGTLVGLEIPLLLRILKDQVKFKDLVSQVLTFDYAGSLVAALIFPLFLVPHLGLVRSSLFFGFINAAVGLWSTWLLAPVLPELQKLRLKAVAVCALLLVGFAFGERLTFFYEDQLYSDEVVYAKSSPYQRIVVTRSKRGFSLFLNGHLQFASVDEYRYHEALVHPGMVHAPRRKSVLILGGGDGLAAREVLRYPEVETITLVDLDEAITALAKSYRELADQNQRALSHPKVTVVNTDAMRFLAEGDARYDVVIIDFPDPNNFSLGKLYTTRFYDLLQRRLAKGGVVAIQSTSPLFARKSYWCVVQTMEAAGFWTKPYHALVPSFGEWGYVLASREPGVRLHPLPEGLRFLDEATLSNLPEFPPDMSRVPTEVNRLNNQVLVHYFDEEWGRWD